MANASLSIDFCASMLAICLGCHRVNALNKNVEYFAEELLSEITIAFPQTCALANTFPPFKTMLLVPAAINQDFKAFKKCIENHSITAITKNQFFSREYQVLRKLIIYDN